MVSHCPVCHSSEIYRKVGKPSVSDSHGLQTYWSYTTGEGVLPNPSRGEYLVAEWCNKCKVTFAVE